MADDFFTTRLKEQDIIEKLDASVKEIIDGIINEATVIIQRLDKLGIGKS